MRKPVLFLAKTTERNQYKVRLRGWKRHAGQASNSKGTLDEQLEGIRDVTTQ